MLALVMTIAMSPVFSLQCNVPIVTLSKEDLANFLLEIAPPFESLQGLVASVVPFLQNGVQVRKVCASCADYPNPDLCPSTAYGFDTDHSGLLLAPISTSSDETDVQPTLAAGTNLLNLHFHGAARHPQAVPSASWPPNLLTTAGFDVFLGLAFTGTTGTYTLL